MSLIESSKAVKTIPFSGKKEDFFLWSVRFLSYCHVQGCKKSLLGNDIPPNANTVIDESTDAGKLLLKSRNANNTAIILLTLSVTDLVSINAISNAATVNLPDGNASIAWNNLLKIYKCKSLSRKYELTQEFQNCMLTRDDHDPEEFFAELEHLRIQLLTDYELDYDDDHMKQHILYNIKANMYKTTLLVLKRELNKDPLLTLASIKTDISLIFQSNTLHNKKKTQKETDTILLAKTKFKKKYKGSCNICGRKGHKSNDCFENPKSPKYKGTPVKHDKSDAAHVAQNKTIKKLCTYCKGTNHTVDRCFKKEKDLKNKDKNETAEIAYSLITVDTDNNVTHKTELSLSVLRNKHAMITPDTFIADSGATCHMRGSTKGMFNLKHYTTSITVGNNSTMMSEKIGDYKGMVLQQDGSTTNIILNDVLYVPDLFANLLSLTKAIEHKNVQLGSKNKLITLKIGPQKSIKFDKEIKNGSGRLLGVEILPRTQDITSLSQDTPIDYHIMHEMLGHANEAVVKATSKKYNFKLKGTPTTCKNCALAKSKKKNIPKTNFNPATEIGERVSIDISSAHAKSFGGAQFWLLIQDEFSGYLWSYFLKNKSDLPQQMMTWLNILNKEVKFKIRSIRLDNSGENKSFKVLIDQHKTYKIKFEFTAPGTPEQNGKIERMFATLYGKTRSILNAARLTETLRNGLWAQCAFLTCKLENIIVKTSDLKSASEIFYGKNPIWIKNLKTFGEVAIVSDHTQRKMKNKLSDRGFACLFIGYPDNHAKDVFQFLNLDTKGILHSRDVIWLNQNYAEYKGITNFNVTQRSPNNEIFYDEDEQEGSDDDASIEVILPNNPVHNRVVQPVPVPSAPISTRQLRSQVTAAPLGRQLRSQSTAPKSTSPISKQISMMNLVYEDYKNDLFCFQHGRRI
jgi:hypothetical protein